MFFSRLVVAGLLSILLLSYGVSGRDREAARAAYSVARRYHDQLLQTSHSSRSRKKYNRAIFLYRKVVDHDPTYGACDDALYAIATLYDEMARRFENDNARHQAVSHYEFLASQYPLTKHRVPALRRAEELKRSQLPATTASAPIDPSVPVELATVSEIRYWSNKDYTRLVIELDREVEFEKHILSNPQRIFFDLKGTRLKSELIGKTYAVNDVFIKRVRVGANRPGVTRIVLDFEKIQKHTVFALYDPFRIVIDTRGDKQQTHSDPKQERTTRTVEAVIPLKTASGKQEVATVAPVIPSPNLHGDWSLTRTLGLKIGRVVIDPGHGGKDTGSIGPAGLREKDLVLEVALRLKTLLEGRLGTDVILTRSKDEFKPLEERTAIANQQNADLFVSVHANATRNPKVSGAETFFLNFASSADEREVATRENANSQKNIHDLENLLRQIALGDYNAESRDLAQVVQNSLASAMKRDRRTFRNRGVKKAPFIVLIGSNMPSILTEVGFISNPSEEAYLKTEAARDQVAEALYQGIAAYFRALGTRLLREESARVRNGSNLR